MLLLAGDANPPGLLLEQNFALWFGKARGDPAPSKFNGLSHRCCFHACQTFSTRCEREDSKRPPLQDEEPTAQLCKQSWADLPWSWHMQSRLRSRRVWISTHLFGSAVAPPQNLLLTGLVTAWNGDRRPWEPQSRQQRYKGWDHFTWGWRKMQQFCLLRNLHVFRHSLFRNKHWNRLSVKRIYTAI